jgi:hypothetical protein
MNSQTQQTSNTSCQANIIETRFVGSTDITIKDHAIVLDGGADTSLCGADFRVMETSNRKVDVCGYNKKVTTKAVTIVLLSLWLKPITDPDSSCM